MKHTPGPWMQAASNRHRIIGNFSGYSAEVCTVQRGQPGAQLSPEMGKANAILIAAAPLLLEALEAARRWGLAYANDEKKAALLQQIQAAIDAAKGE